MRAEVMFSAVTDSVLSDNGYPARRSKRLVADLRQVVSGQTGHLHHRVAIKSAGQHGAGDFQRRFALAFLAPLFNTALFTQLDTLLDTFFFKRLPILMLRHPQGQFAYKCLRINRFTGLDNIVYQ